MRLVAALVLVAACDAGEKKQPRDEVPPHVALDNHGSARAPVDATIAALPPSCSPEDLGVSGEQQTPRLVSYEGCAPRWEEIEDVIWDQRRADSGVNDGHGKPLEPPSQRVVYLNAGPSAIEITSASMLAKLVACRRALRVDWKRDRVWLVTFSAEDGFMTTESVIDDGQRVALGLLTGREKSCGDAAPPLNKLLQLVLVPHGRDVVLKQCRDDRPDPCPGYDGKGG